jgi:hypothetical protein
MILMILEIFQVIRKVQQIQTRVINHQNIQQMMRIILNIKDKENTDH